MSQNQFCKLFLDKYFPVVLQEVKVYEFLRLIQGSTTMMDYEAKFTRLARFATDIVPTDEKRVCRFEGGRRPFILSKVSVLRLSTYAQVVERALTT